MENNTPQIEITEHDENNTLQNEITEQDEENEVLTSMRNKLDSMNISFNENWYIYKVLENLLKGHEYCYEPLVMSIGPVFYKKDPKLEPMQKVKWIYLKRFLQHSENARQHLNPYIDYVRNKEGEIRECYEHEFELSSDDFVEMIVLDAAFLICYLLCKKWPKWFEVPLVGNNLKAKMADANFDLFLLENQIPYFVLKEIFHTAFGHLYSPIELIRATLAFINSLSIGILGIKAIKRTTEDDKITVYSNVKHILDFQRMRFCLTLSTPLRNQPITNPTTDSDSYIHRVMSWICASSLCNQPITNPTTDTDSYIHKVMSRISASSICNQQITNPTTDSDSYIHKVMSWSCASSLCNRLRKRHPEKRAGNYSIYHLCYTAKQLNDAGVTFVAGETDNPLDVTFANGKLRISILDIYDETESHLRNLVYFEQCHYYRDTYFIDYILFLDQLIDTVEDVQVLVKSKIISNQLGSDDGVVKLFNNIGKNMVVTSKNYYYDVSNDLNRYALTRRHRWMATLRSKYFSHPWAVMSVITAILLFALTLLQTIAAYFYK